MKEEQGVTLELGITIETKYDPETSILSIKINGKEVERKIMTLENVAQEPLVVEWDSPIKYTPIDGWDSPIKYTSINEWNSPIEYADQFLA